MPITTEAAGKILAVLKETFKKPPLLSGKNEYEKVNIVVGSIDRRQFVALSMLVEDVDTDFLMKRSGTGISITFS